jgi:hypothetical protein
LRSLKTRSPLGLLPIIRSSILWFFLWDHPLCARGMSSPNSQSSPHQRIVKQSPKRKANRFSSSNFPQQSKGLPAIITSPLHLPLSLSLSLDSLIKGTTPQSNPLLLGSSTFPLPLSLRAHHDRFLLESKPKPLIGKIGKIQITKSGKMFLVLDPAVVLDPTSASSKIPTKYEVCPSPPALLSN